jgi:hypothetical protein
MLRHQDLNIDLETLERLSRDELRALWTQKLGESHPNRSGGMSSRSASRTRGRNGSTAVLQSRSPRNWTVCSPMPLLVA